jgi:hypothetical protein
VSANAIIKPNFVSLIKIASVVDKICCRILVATFCFASATVVVVFSFSSLLSSFLLSLLSSFFSSLFDSCLVSVLAVVVSVLVSVLVCR